MTALNGEQAGGSVSRRGLQVAARLAALWCDARLAAGLAGLTGRNDFGVINLARRDDNPMRRNRRRRYRGSRRSYRGRGCRPVSPQAALMRRGFAGVRARYPETRRGAELHKLKVRKRAGKRGRRLHPHTGGVAHSSRIIEAHRAASRNWEMPQL